MSLKVPGLGSIANPIDGIANTGDNLANTFGASQINTYFPAGGAILGLVEGKNYSSWLQRMRGRLDPLMAYSWTVTMPFNLPPEYVEDINYNGAQFQVNSTNRNDTVVYWAGITNQPECTISFYEDEVLTVSTWLDAWMNHIRLPNGTRSPVDSYQKVITISTQDATFTNTATFKLIGAWPVYKPSHNFSGASPSDRLIVQVPFMINRVEFHANGNQYTGALSALLGSVVSSFPGLSPLVSYTKNLISSL